MTDVGELQGTIAATRAERGFTTDPVRMLCLLTEEVGEIAGELKRTWSPNYPEFDTSDLANEIADVYVLLNALASSYSIDVETAVRSKFFDDDSKRTWASADKP
jgi:NTP pyrophosphatase (non-canonical NTP hydrolase)